MPASPSPARSHRRMPPARAALAALACAVLLGTTACSSPDGEEPGASAAPPSTSAEAEPIFASDEEALAAAVEAYTAYSDASNRIANAGGEGAEGISVFVTADVNEVLQEEFAAVREGGLRTVGVTIVYGGVLDEWNEDPNGAEVAAFLCRDVSGTRVVRADGSDATSADRDPIQAVRATFISEPGQPSTLIISGIERWQDESHC
ncbi:hypothetical protein [Agromyces sp. ZXT2-6]|uniref:hypothetical protein n=1 Tax=Agromyces sp. ZXT2-6 TaxID=3461153 RepID=UPI00405533C4